MLSKEETPYKSATSTELEIKDIVGSLTVTPTTLSSKRQRTKRSPACRRCHERKVKCSGGQPCKNCRLANNDADCSYPRKDRLIKVGQQYIDNLIAENKRLRSRDAMSKTRPETNDLDIMTTSTNSQVEDAWSLPIALPKECPWLLDTEVSHAPNLIGEASDIAFTMRFCHAMSEPGYNYIPRIDYLPDEKLLTLSDEHCPWPIPSRARLLINIALKHMNRSYYHIVRRSQILEGLEQTFQNSHLTNSLLERKLWALFAIGEMYSTRISAKGRNFPGMAYFARATRNFRVIDEQPEIEAIEISLLLLFYSLALNRHHTAYALAGSSIRLAVTIGLHLNISEFQIRGSGPREHRNRLWWTAYCFDRICASRLGYPVSIQDDDIEVDLPSSLALEISSDDFLDSSYLIASIRLARLSVKVMNTVYTRKSQQKNLLQQAQQAVTDLDTFLEELPPYLHIRSNNILNPNLECLSLHLYLNHVAITATRPILLQVLRTHITTWDIETKTEPRIPALAITLSKACIQHARSSSQLLVKCWIDGSFTTFDYSYTQYLFAAATILAISSLIESAEYWSDKDKFESAAYFLAQQKENGNLAAEEFCRHIDATLDCITAIRVSRDHLTIPVEGLLCQDEPGITNSVVDMAGSNWSIQGSLSQPVLDLHSSDASKHSDDLQEWYPTGMSPESWAANF